MIRNTLFFFDEDFLKLKQNTIKVALLQGMYKCNLFNRFEFFSSMIRSIPYEQKKKHQPLEKM